MLAAKVALPLAVLFLASPASLASCHSRVSRAPRSGQERQEEQDPYFEQCRVVAAWKEHLGYVSVLAFLDPAWRYSFRQAVMLELLSSRFRKSGFPDIRFFAISPASDSSAENERSEEDLDEIEAWRAIGAKHEDSLAGHDFLRSNGSEIILLQDDPQSRMWERFRASRDQVVVIDRCGKLAYHVLVPWSILYYPYVKAAILSTHEEDPCGGCDPGVYRVPSPEEQVVKLRKVTDEEDANSTQNKTEANVEATWTTGSLENATLRQDSSSEEEREASSVSSSLPEEITNDAGLIVSTESPTESTTYRYNNSATESRFDKDRPDAEGTPDQEDPTNSWSGGTSTSSETATTFELQRDVYSTEQAGSSLADNSPTPATLGNHGDRTLSLDEQATDEAESDSTPADGETTSTTDLADEVRDRNTTPENTESFGEDALPLRIIMYAPHLHKNSRKTRKYTHLVLKTGDPGFHGHLDFEVDVASTTDSWPEADSRVTSSEEYDWETTKTGADEENVNQKYTFDKDEKPGLYGEVLDYWRSYEDNDITDRNETINDTYSNSTTNNNEEHRTNIDQTSFSKPEESHSESSTDPQNIGSSTIESSRPINTNNQADKEEMQDKLIEHYSKLFSWMEYKLSK
ncbi:PREDICTED: uncharacterized protein LOC105563963 isoform X2 [Vollenhovia emeryi]|uniref:uncharacterized protein LOC105563963 isoform X2 n=1 Tax=Vollenhovia emeryi TaxID=411798 RepID=UPI0005F45AB1|nr:PREDICTED: uncharacterized protein LOC105563963 isoform X2 [Vollenhovia emeryi]